MLSLLMGAGAFAAQTRLDAFVAKIKGMDVQGRKAAMKALTPADRKALHAELVESGALVPVAIEGLRGTRFVVADEVELLESPPPAAPSVAFIAPFDSLLWDTKLLEQLFGFEFVWEGFFQPAKRRWGYYVLPILFGDRFVGRIEPRIENGGVEVLGLWWEDGFDPHAVEGFDDALDEALAAYTRFAYAAA